MTSLDIKKSNIAVKHSVKNIGKRQFTVTRYYIGSKSIDEILTRIAILKTYEDIENGLIFNNKTNNSVNDLAKSEAI